jgi:hypothetical protein
MAEYKTACKQGARKDSCRARPRVSGEPGVNYSTTPLIGKIPN